MIRRLIIVCLALVAWWATSCGGGGGVSAPPIELDAPITGRITISAPDATGKVVITGAVGAAEPDSILMAVNESQVSPSLSKAVDLGSIAVCNEPGHYCTTVRSDGSFEIILLNASEGDFIFLVLINEQGEEISERAFFTIQAEELELELGVCAGEEVDRSIAGLLNLEGKTLLLQEGSETHSNLLTYDIFPIPIPGCHARALGMIPIGGDSKKLVALSSIDKKAWSGTWNGLTFTNVDTFELDYEPLDIAYVGDPGIAALAVKTETGFAVAHLNLTDGTIPLIVDVPEPDPAHTLSDVIALRSAGPFEDGRYLLALLTRGGNAAEQLSYITFFDGTTLENKTADQETLPLDEELFLSQPPDPLPQVDDITDAVMDQVTTSLFMLIVNHGQRIMHIRLVFGLLGGQQTIVSVNDPLNLIAELRLGKDPVFSKDFDFQDVAPRKIAIGRDDSGEIVAYLTADVPDLLIVTILFSSTVDPQLERFGIADLADPVAIATYEDPLVQSILIGDGNPSIDDDGIEAAEIFDASDLWVN